MKKSWAVISIAVLFLMLCKFSLAEDNQASGFSNLSLELTTTKDEFIQREPIPVTVRLSNKTDRPIWGHIDLNFSRPFCKLFVINGGERQEIDRSLLIIDGITRRKLIRPGKYYQQREILSLGLERVFPRPGLYEIEAEFLNLDQTEEIRSNRLKIRISEPKGNDLQAFNYLQSKGPYYYIFAPASNVPESELKEFVSKFGDTTYGDYALFTLAKHNFFREKYDDAIEGFEKLKAKTDFPFPDRVLSYLTLTSVKLNNLEKAKSYFETLKARYPKSEYIEKTRAFANTGID